MPRAAAWLAKSAVAVALVAAPALAHIAGQAEHGTNFAASLIAVQAALVTWLVLSLTGKPAIRLIGSIAAFLLSLIVWRFAQDGALLSCAVPHTVINLSL